MPLILVMLIALLPRLASGQETPGFTCCDEPTGGEAIENFFSEDPNLSDVPAFSRLISTWTNGFFTNPDPDKGTYEVIRL